MTPGRGEDSGGRRPKGERPVGRDESGTREEPVPESSGADTSDADASDAHTPDAHTPDAHTPDASDVDADAGRTATGGDHDHHDPDGADVDEPDPDEPGSDDPDVDGADPDADGADPDEPDIDPGDTLFAEPGGSWWVVAIGPVLVGAVLIMEIAGPGSVHWPIMLIFLAILVGFSVVQVSAARRHVSVELTETTLRQGAERIRLDQIARIYPENNDPTAKDWESAPALGELHGVPRRRKGVGVKLTSGKIAQAWARDVDRFRSELTTAHQAIELGLPPRGGRDT